MEKYPYFLYPVLVELNGAPSPERRQKLREIIAANVGDRDTLVALIGDLEEDLRSFYPDQTVLHHDTDDTIDSFIAKFGGSQALPEALAELTTEPAPEPEPAPESEPEPEEESRPLPDPVKEPEPELEPELAEDPLEKAKMLVKNHDYKGALEIMEEIYLNNPKKSVYFADQIRFIRKMMLNDSKTRH